jgi:hypothetical protein
MRSRATASFWKLFAKLPREVQLNAYKAYRLWRANPAAHSLYFKRVRHEEAIYSVRIGLDYRALGVLEGDTIYWFWIGDHDEYDRILR